jgi:integrase
MRLVPEDKKRRGRGEGTYQMTRKGVYRLRVYAGRDPITGKPHQVSRTVYARTESEARKALRRFVTEVEGGKVAKIGVQATVEHLLKAWLENLKGSKAQTTLETYRLITETHLIPAMGKLELRTLSAHHLDRYYQACLAAGTAPRTIRLRHSILSGALTQAVKWGWLDRNPAGFATPPKLPRGVNFIPEVEQVKRLIEVAGDDPELATAIVLAAITGARRGELCGLRWQDWDRTANTLLIERQRVPVTGGNVTAPLKHGDRRTVALGALGVAVLRRYESDVTERADQLSVDPDWDGWLLSHDCGRSPMRPQQLGEAITALGKKAKVPVTTHAFRRFAATQMVGAGVDVRTAAGRLGHTPEVMLRRYAGFMPSRDLEAAHGLEGLVLDVVP